MRNNSTFKYYTVTITFNRSNLWRPGVIRTVTRYMFRYKYFTGNLTRLRAVTRSLILARCDETLLLLLAHTNSNIVTAASGTLVNLSGDPDWRVTYTVQTSPKGAYLYVCVSARVRAHILVFSFTFTSHCFFTSASYCVFEYRVCSFSLFCQRVLSCLTNFFQSI